MSDRQSPAESALQWWQKHFGLCELSKTVPSVERWFDSPLGVEVLRAEQEWLDETLSYLFGYHLLQLSITRDEVLYQNSRINHRFALHPMIRSVGASSSLGASSTNIQGMAHFEHLPLEKQSIDVAIVHHLLEYTKDPRRLLRELAWSIAPHGYLIVICFNPWSLMGMMRTTKRLVSRSPDLRARRVSLSRTLDWLQLLDFEPTQICRLLFRPPINHASSLRYLQWVERVGQRLDVGAGGVYVVVARKQMAAVRPTKAGWSTLSPRLSVIPVGQAVACRDSTSMGAMLTGDDQRQGERDTRVHPNASAHPSASAHLNASGPPCPSGDLIETSVNLSRPSKEGLAETFIKTKKKEPH